MTLRPILAMLAAGTALAACQPPAETSVSVSPTTGAATVTAPATSTIAVGSETTPGTEVAVVP